MIEIVLWALRNIFLNLISRGPSSTVADVEAPSTFRSWISECFGLDCTFVEHNFDHVSHKQELETNRCQIVSALAVDVDQERVVCRAEKPITLVNCITVQQHHYDCHQYVHIHPTGEELHHFSNEGNTGKKQLEVKLTRTSFNPALACLSLLRINPRRSFSSNAQTKDIGIPKVTSPS